MSWEETFASKGYKFIGKCCGGWHKYTPEDNITITQIGGRQVYSPKDHRKVIKVLRGRFRYHAQGGLMYRSLNELESYLNTL